MQQGRHFGSHSLTFHRWIKLIFGYVIMLNVTYILTGGIVNIRLCLRAVTGGTFLENHPSRQPCSSAVMYFLNSRSLNFRSVQYCSDIGSFNRWIYVNFGYVILMTMMYNSTVWMYWTLNLNNDVLSLVWEILNENMRVSIKKICFGTKDNGNGLMMMVVFVFCLSHVWCVDKWWYS